MVTAVLSKIAEVLGVVALHSWTEHVVLDRKMLMNALRHSSVLRSRRIRVSMAQILSIRVDEKYVLIDNIERLERVTPIGGVVRYFPSAVPVLENEIGSLETGKRADFVILDRDILACPEEEIARILPVATYVEGKPVFERR